MKTTVEIDDDLLKAAKKRAIDDGTTLRAFLECAIRERLSSQPGLGAYGAFETRAELCEEPSKILDDLEAAFREYQERREGSRS